MKKKTNKPETVRRMNSEFSEAIKKAFDEPVFDPDKAFEDFNFPEVEAFDEPVFDPDKLDWPRIEDIDWPDVNAIDWPDIGK